MVFPHRASAEPRQRTHLTLSSGFTFLQSSPRLHLANALPGARRRRPLMGSCSLQHMQGSGVHSRGFASPATFRLQGLVTLLAVSSPRTRAGLVSCRQRSWDSALRSFLLSRGAPDVSAKDGPTCRFACRCSCERVRRPARQTSASGLRPSRESLAPSSAINTDGTGCSLGLPPFPGPPTGCLAGASAPAPLTRLAVAVALTATLLAPQSIPQHPARPTSPSSRSWSTLSGRPLKVSAPPRPCRSSRPQPGLCVHLAARPPSLAPDAALWVASVSPTSADRIEPGFPDLQPLRTAFLKNPACFSIRKRHLRNRIR
jgi:hypothetical protein